MYFSHAPTVLPYAVDIPNSPYAFAFDCSADGANGTKLQISVGSAGPADGFNVSDSFNGFQSSPTGTDVNVLAPVDNDQARESLQDSVVLTDLVTKTSWTLNYMVVDDNNNNGNYNCYLSGSIVEAPATS